MSALETTELIFPIPVTFLRIFSTFIFIQTFSSGTFITIYKKQKNARQRWSLCSTVHTLQSIVHLVGMLEVLLTHSTISTVSQISQLNNFIFDVIFAKLKQISLVFYSLSLES